MVALFLNMVALFLKMGCSHNEDKHRPCFPCVPEAATELNIVKIIKLQQARKKVILCGDSSMSVLMPIFLLHMLDNTDEMVHYHEAPSSLSR